LRWQGQLTRVLGWSKIIALERASGAELAGDSDAYEARLDEAYRFLQDAGRSLGESSDQAGQLAEALAPYSDEESQGRVPLLRRLRRLLGRSTLASELPPEILEQLARVGSRVCKKVTC
jgi:hypothetical protein